MVSLHVVKGPDNGGSTTMAQRLVRYLLDQGIGHQVYRRATTERPRRQRPQLITQARFGELVRRANVLSMQKVAPAKASQPSGRIESVEVKLDRAALDRHFFGSWGSDGDVLGEAYRAAGWISRSLPLRVFEPNIFGGDNCLIYSFDRNNYLLFQRLGHDVDDGSGISANVWYWRGRRGKQAEEDFSGSHPGDRGNSFGAIIGRAAGWQADENRR